MFDLHPNNVTAVNSDCSFPKFNVDSNATVFVVIKNLDDLSVPV